MSKPNEIVCQVLKLSIPPSSLNLYALLGVKELSSDNQAITTAIQNCINTLKQEATNYSPEQINVVKSAIKQCHATLTDPTRKSQYDQQLGKAIQRAKNVAQEPNAAPENIARELAPENQTEPPAKLATVTPPPAKATVERIQPEFSDPLDEILPVGDPLAEFSMKEHLAQSTKSDAIESVESRLNALQRLSSPNASANSPPELTFHSAAIGNEARSMAAGGGNSIQQRMRRKRIIRDSLTLGGLGLMAIALIGFATYRFLNPSLGKSVASNVADSETELANQLPSIENELVPAGTNNLDTNSETENSDTRQTKATRPVKPRRDQPNSFGELPAIGDSFAASEDGQFFTDSAPADAPEPPSAMAVMETKYDAKRWEELKSLTRSSIASKDFANFDANVAELLAMRIPNANLENERKLIDRTGQLYRIANESFNTAVNELGSGEAIEMADGKMINFIESKGQQLKFRIDGKNADFAVDQMPANVVAKILTMGLDAQAAVDLAAQGLFLKLYSSDEEFQQRGDELLQQAAALDKKFSSLDDLTASEYAK